MFYIILYVKKKIFAFFVVCNVAYYHFVVDITVECLKIMIQKNV